MPVTLDLPSVLSTAGPTYATKINTAITTAANALHTGGDEGAKWTAASLGIDGDVSWGGYSITSIKAAAFAQQASVLTQNSVYFKTDNNLWCTNGNGTAIQITSGGGLNTAALITAIWSQLALATEHTIVASDDYTHFKVDTTAARAITLPTAPDAGAGRFYVISDVTGTAAANNITISRAGTDTINGATSYVIDRNYGYALLVSDGTSAWSVASPLNATTTTHGLVQLTQDLAGTASAPTVTAVTGASGTLAIRAGCDTLEFAATSSPTIRQAASTTGAGSALELVAQGAGGTNQDGGVVNIHGGAASGTGTPGSVTLSSSVSAGLRVGAFSGARRYVSLGVSMPLSTDIPTGDGVVYIGNCVTAPTSNPVAGGVLFVDAGALVYRGTSGTVTTLALA